MFLTFFEKNTKSGLNLVISNQKSRTKIEKRIGMEKQAKERTRANGS